MYDKINKLQIYMTLYNTTCTHVHVSIQHVQCNVDL